MIGRALLYLWATSLAGLITSRLRRLRQPKYLAGAVVGAAYFYFFILRRAFVVFRGRPSSVAGAPGGDLPGFAELTALALFVIMAINWLVPRRAALTFSEPEMAFLFPAPVKRRTLIQYHLLRSQFSLMFTALVGALVFPRGPGGRGDIWVHAIGWWITLTTVKLHVTGTSFVYSKLLNRSATSPRGRMLSLAAPAVGAVLLIGWVWISLRVPRADETATLQLFAQYVSSQLHAAPVSWVLAVPTLIVAPSFAHGLRPFLFALGPALAVLVAHYYWVVHVEVSFEEASIARAREARVRAAPQGDWRGRETRKAQRAPFPLRGIGRPEMAFLWKNLLSTHAWLRPKALLVTAVVVLVGCTWLTQRADLESYRLAGVPFFGSLLLLLLGGGTLVARQDLRTDLAHADLLKTYPLPAWQIVLGEMLTPVWILSALIWICLLAEAALLPGDRLPWLTPWTRIAGLAGMALLIPLLVAILVLTPNAAAIIFPGWMHSFGNRSERGLEAMGQRMIFVGAHWLLTLVAIAPAVIAGAVIFVSMDWWLGRDTAITLTLVVIGAVLATEAWLGVRWLGTRFDRLDLTTELQP